MGATGFTVFGADTFAFGIVACGFGIWGLTTLTLLTFAGMDLGAEVFASATLTNPTATATNKTANPTCNFFIDLLVYLS